MNGTDDPGYRLGVRARPRKVVFCVPVFPKPFKETVRSIEAEKKILKDSGWESEVLWQVGIPYISGARAVLLRSALDAQATVILFVDQDISWEPGTALKLIETEGGIVAGTYRYKEDQERYMGALVIGSIGRPLMRADGAVEAQWAPAGFLKVTRDAVNLMMATHPELCWGEASGPNYDMFAHGVLEGNWRGEDVAACIRWRKMGQKLWMAPDLDITHHSVDKAYPGNLAKFLKK